MYLLLSLLITLVNFCLGFSGSGHRSISDSYIDDDNIRDLLVSDKMSQAVYVYTGNGNGTFQLLDQNFFYLSPDDRNCGGGSLCLLDPTKSTNEPIIQLDSNSLNNIATKPYYALQATSTSSPTTEVSSCFIVSIF